MTRRSPASKPRTATQRLVAIVPLLDFLRQKRGGCTITVLLSNGRKPDTSEEIAADIALQCGVCLRSIWRWYDAFKQAGGCAGCAALQRRKRCDCGSSRWFGSRPKAAKLLARLILIQKSTARVAHYELQRSLGQAPCYPTVANRARQLKNAARAARRRGTQKVIA